MSKKRVGVPAAIKNAVLKEYNHKCAICGTERPQLHHIDEDPASNEAMNLIPLCPNCHLTDQHDATNAIPVDKLKFFRRYKHRNILKPQFNPVFKRMSFLKHIHEKEGHEALVRKVEELMGIVRCLEMGEFYSECLKKLLKVPARGAVVIVGDPASEARFEETIKQHNHQYREQLAAALPEVENLIVEMLDYQVWAGNNEC